MMGGKVREGSKCLPNGNVSNFFPLLQTRIPHRLVDEKCVVMAHESERHDACCWKDIRLGEIVCVRWSRAAISEKFVGVATWRSIKRLRGWLLLLNSQKHFSCFNALRLDSPAAHFFFCFSSTDKQATQKLFVQHLNFSFALLFLQFYNRTKSFFAFFSFSRK